MRGITNCGDEISEEVRKSMFSIFSAFPLPNFEATLQAIANGGLKAAGKKFTLFSLNFTLIRDLQNG